ncbi:MAG: MFS transporter [Candidatus Binataceae bacterium]
MDRAIEPPAPGLAADALHPPRSYLPMLFGLLMSATIFEGYDITIFHLCTPDIVRSFSMSDATIGLVATIVRLGGLASFFLVASADIYGRKPIVSISVFFYAVFTLMTAISRGMISFTIFQTVAQLFLAAEFGVAITMISEEFPDDERGRAIAGLLTVAFLGVAAAGGLYGYVAPSRWGWRGMYFIGIAPLVLTIFLRRGLRETMRFRALTAARTSAGTTRGNPWPNIRESIRELTGPYRSRLIVVAILWNSIGLVGGPTITFFSLFARREHNWSATQVGVAIVVAYLMGSVGSLLAGWAVDRIGRRVATSFFYLCAALSMAALFRSASFRGLMLGLIATMFSYQAARTATSALSAELFPTEIRACGYSLTVQVFGQFGWALSPLIVGLLAYPLGGLGNAAAIFAFGPIIGVIVVMGWIPETRGLTLEQISPPAAP